jgi:hypothetical protein
LGLLGRLIAVPLLAGLLLSGSSASGSADYAHNCRLASLAFEVNGTVMPLAAARRGDHVVASFTVPKGCLNRMTFVSFVAPNPRFDGSRLREQVQFARDSGVFGPGPHSLAIDVYGFPSSTLDDCGAAPRPKAVVGRTGDRGAVVVFEHVDEVDGVTAGSAAGGACGSDPASVAVVYGSANGQPCAGCVGNADDTHPPGQDPGGADGNAGHECDRNHGVGDGNPAHGGCHNFQIDLSFVSFESGETAVPSHEIVAATFCVRDAKVCYATDRSDTQAVVGDLGSS